MAQTFRGLADGHHTSLSSELQEVADGLVDAISTDDLNGLIDRVVTAANSAPEQGTTMRQRFSELADRALCRT